MTLSPPVVVQQSRMEVLAPGMCNMLGIDRSTLVAQGWRRTATRMD
jgi:hypothetical protein